MGQEHAPETVWKAQELYCSDRLSFVKVADITGVADSTLRRWADMYGWREKREGIAKAEADIRADKVLARAKTVKALLDKPSANMAFAVSALEAQALKEAEAARMLVDRAAQEDTPPVVIDTPAAAVAALRKAIELRLNMLLTRPEGVNLKAVQEIQKCALLADEMQKALPADTAEPQGQKGLDEEMYSRLLDVLSGKVEV